MVDLIRQLLQALHDPAALGQVIQQGGTLMVCAIVFVETGLFVGFFLPGDSLLVMAGVFAAAGKLEIVTLLLLVTLCAIVGDQCGYWIGRRAGKALYSRKDSLFFKRKHLERAHEFYEQYGGKTVILARFMPIVRTFCPPVAGAAEMSYTRYLLYDIAGGCIWCGTTILGGYFLASLVPNISQKIHYVIAVVIILSFLPPVISLWRARSRSAGRPDPPAGPASHQFRSVAMAGQRRSPKAVIFDIGRVIVHLEPERALAPLASGGAGLSSELIWHAVLNDPRWNDWQEGRMDPRQWHEHLTRQLNISMEFREFCDAWNRTLHPETILKESLFTNIARQCKLAVLSNTDPLHSALLDAEFPFLQHFPIRIYSCRVGASKPSPVIFQAALDALDVSGGEALFVDDMAEYVGAARKLGLDAFQFESRTQLLREFALRGLPGE